MYVANVTGCYLKSVKRRLVNLVSLGGRGLNSKRYLSVKSERRGVISLDIETWSSLFRSSRALIFCQSSAADDRASPVAEVSSIAAQRRQ